MSTSRVRADRHLDQPDDVPAPAGLESGDDGEASAEAARHGRERAAAVRGARDALGPRKAARCFGGGPRFGEVGL
eukprot:6183630-Pleurochrysis_carterae.AAC.2